MVVIFIIGLLATVVLINVLPSQDKAMVVKARSDIATLEQGMEMYRLDMASYPGQAEGLERAEDAACQPGDAAELPFGRLCEGPAERPVGPRLSVSGAGA